MRFLDALQGFKQHPSVPHVVYRVSPTSRALILDAKCYRCGKAFHWECMNVDRAASRIDTWAAFPCNLH